MSSPITGFYPFAAPGTEIELYNGSGSWSGGTGQMSFAMPLNDGLDIHWRLVDGGMDIDLGDKEISLTHPRFGDSKVGVRVRHSDGLGYVVGALLGSKGPVHGVVSHWFNLPIMLPAAGLADSGVDWSGRVELSADGWRMTLDSRPDLASALRDADKDLDPFVLTHVGLLNRSDGSAFSFDAAENTLFAYQLALSFALGRFVAPAMPTGVDDSGSPLWEQWAPWRCVARKGYQGWWNTHRVPDLEEFVATYVPRLLDPTDGPVLRHLAMHAISASRSETTAEGKVMLAMAGLEFAAWTGLVFPGVISKGRYRSLSWADSLRLFLNKYRIPTAVPPELSTLQAVAASRSFDGPGVVSWVRNRLVHPKDPYEVYRDEGLVWETSVLAREYIELGVLSRLGFEGEYVPRYPPGRWHTDSVAVPWSSATTTPDS